MSMPVTRFAPISILNQCLSISQSRYIVFRPAGHAMPEFAVKIDGADLAPISLQYLAPDDREDIQDELQRHAGTGLRGWAAKFIVKKRDGTTQIREAFTYHRSQEAQITFKDFGGDIQEITLILINMHPDVERVVIPGGSFGGFCQLCGGRRHRWVCFQTHRSFKVLTDRL